MTNKLVAVGLMLACAGAGWCSSIRSGHVPLAAPGALAMAPVMRIAVSDAREASLRARITGRVFSRPVLLEVDDNGSAIRLYSEITIEFLADGSLIKRDRLIPSAKLIKYIIEDETIFAGGDRYVLSKDGMFLEENGELSYTLKEGTR